MDDPVANRDQESALYPFPANPGALGTLALMPMRQELMNRIEWDTAICPAGQTINVNSSHSDYGYSAQHAVPNETSPAKAEPPQHEVSEIWFGCG